MTTLNPLFALTVFFLAFITAFLIKGKGKSGKSANRFETIDGLRGFLAVNVYIHHSSVWYIYLRTGNWLTPNSNLLNQLGLTSVAFFFMISSFLFVTRLIEFKGERFDWKSFFIKRSFRLVPLHIFVVLVIILIVFIQSNWELNTNYLSIVKSIISWFGFGILGGLPDINNVIASGINAGVLWSLSYEWLLYFSLPLISIIILKNKPSIFFLLLSLSFIIVTLQFRSYSFHHILSFLGGAIAPIILKFNKKNINFNSQWYSLIILISIILIFQFHSSSNHVCKFFITVSFTLIALGNDFWGILRNKTLQFLGEISYSTYLLHGVIIFVTIHFVYGFEETKQLSQGQYYILIFIISPLVILISFLTYNLIEMPFMKISKRFTMDISVMLTRVSVILTHLAECGSKNR